MCSIGHLSKQVQYPEEAFHQIYSIISIGTIRGCGRESLVWNTFSAEQRFQFWAESEK